MSNLKAIKAAMRHAAAQGFDPYNSHETQARVMERRWRMESGARKARERHARSEAIANAWLAQELSSERDDRATLAIACGLPMMLAPQAE